VIIFVPIAPSLWPRGRSRNAPVSETVAMAQSIIREGAKEMVLTGVNIGDFGKSTGESFWTC